MTPGRATAVVAALCAGAVALALGSTRAAQRRLPAGALLPEPEFAPLALLRLDAHQRFGAHAVNDAVRLAELNGIRALVNLAGGSPGGALEAQLAAARPFGARVSVFMSLDLDGCCSEAWARREASRVAEAKALGARGVDVEDASGLAGGEGAPAVAPLDAPAADLVWAACAELGMPVVLGGAGPPALRVVERHPKATFVGAAFAGRADDPAEVARLMDRLPNLWVDTAGAVPALGVRAAAARAALLAHPDRVLFGTGVQIVDAPESKAAIYGSGPPYLLESGQARGRAMARFFDGNARFLETRDRAIPSPDEEEGAPDVEGVGLPRSALEAIYHGNAERLLHVTLPEER